MDYNSVKGNQDTLFQRNAVTQVIADQTRVEFFRLYDSFPIR